MPKDVIPTRRITIVCACCEWPIVARDAFRRAAGVMVCGNCDAREQPGCLNCKPPYFGGALDG